MHEGFDTHADTLGFSKFHLEQYIEAVRKIVDATILTGERPSSQRRHFSGGDILSAHTSQNARRPERRGKREGFDFLDPRRAAYFENFKTVPETGRYKITIRATGKDRGLYASKETGIYDDDPIRLRVRLGDRERFHDLPDEEVMEIELDEWIAAGSLLTLHYPTDGLKMRSNGNFKFQNAIAGEYLKQHNPERYAQVVAKNEKQPERKRKSPKSWHLWVNDWMGPRPRVLSATIEGPTFESWPPARQVALIGRNRA